MKQFGHTFKHFIISSTLVLTSLSYPFSSFAQVDPVIEQQKAECAKNSAAEWSAKTNTCVGKVEDRKTRHEVEDCSKIADIEQRKECHKKIAEQKTGLNSDPNSLPQGTGSGSAVMNGAAMAYTVISMISGAATGSGESACTSKKIFGVTSIAGVLSDIWLKIKAKKALNALKDKYQVDVKKGAYDAQSKAFEYLKDEQQTVKEIASREKKRNMLLMVGYGAAAAMAVYEWAMPQANPQCYKKEVATENTAVSQAKQQAEAAATPATSETAAQTPPPPPPPAAAAAPAIEGQTASIDSDVPKPEINKGGLPTQDFPSGSMEATAQNGEAAASASPNRYEVSGSGKNMQVKEFGPDGKPTGNVVVTHEGKSFVVDNKTGKVVGPVPGVAKIGWSDGRSQPIPSNLIKTGSSVNGTSNINFSGKTDMKVNNTNYKLKR